MQVVTLALVASLSLSIRFFLAVSLALVFSRNRKSCSAISFAAFAAAAACSWFCKGNKNNEKQKKKLDVHGTNSCMVTDS